MTAAALLSVRDLSIAFRQGERQALAVDRISFDIRKGETLALVGESGSGKSATALSIMKLLPYPAASHPSGQVLFKGQDLLSLAERKIREIRGADITIIFQEPMTSLNPLHTIERQIGEILLLHRGLTGKPALDRILELLTQVGIPNPAQRLKAYPHQLSGGQRQRVMIAMALANEPDLLIADEPTTALDVTVQAQILKLLKELQGRLGMAMLFITHDLGIVRKIADRVCVMKDGKIVEANNVTDIFKSPQHPYTRALLAAEPRPQAVPPNPSGKVVIKTDDLKVWFPIRRGVMRKTVGYIKAVDGVSVEVRQGETLGVVGESGSGKTTLGLAILRLISSDGPIVFMGNALQGLRFKEMRPYRRNMQIVFQDPYGSLSPRMSVSDIIQEGMWIHQPHIPRHECEKHVVKALEDVGLDPESRHRYPHEFSGGQRQRIAVARAIVLEPNFVVLDEPTSALDMLIQAQMVDLLCALQKRHDLTYMFISHDLRVVAAMSSQLMVMREGKVVETGPAAQLFKAPQSAYTRALLAAAFNIESPPEAVVAQ
jgi:microcin C transport system ATP-binding protein